MGLVPPHACVRACPAPNTLTKCCVERGAMPYAAVALDIAARELDAPFTYRIPNELEGEVCVGVTVRVAFSGRPAIGYVLAVTESAPAGVPLEKILPVNQVLAGAAFDEGAAELAGWMAREYAAPLADCVRLFVAPGQKVRMTKGQDGSWSLTDKQVGEVDDRWVALTEEGRAFTPRKNAHRQRSLLEALGEGPQRMAELNAMLGAMGTTVRALEKRGLVEVMHRRIVRGMAATSLSSAAAPRHEHLTAGQTAALAAIGEAMGAASGDVVVVDGVTGSGKTEVYLRAIERALETGGGAICLVPEISLTAQTVGRFRARFGDKVAVLHSRLSEGERYDQWDLVRQGIARVVVGARSALFAPLKEVALVVIDEEHEGSYKQDKAPRYHAREVASELCRIKGAALVLGSATPSLESLERSSVGHFRGVRWSRVEMRERPGTSRLPQVRIVDMAHQFRDGGRSVFSGVLARALAEVFERREKAVLLLNRRGFATFLMCRECGCVPECPHCSVPLTYHERAHALICHTCGSSWPQRAFPDPSTSCPNCGSRYMGAFGVGTQRVEDELLMLTEPFESQGKHVEVIRMDADTTRTKGAHEKLLEQFDDAECAVLVGTQMIAKGLDFPEVTLVGVINADTMLKLPDFRAPERTFDLLEQVAGRAGRAELPGRVIVQTYWATHPAILAVGTHDRQIFLESDLAEREGAGYPPFGRLSNVVVWGKDERGVRETAKRLADSVRREAASREGWQVLGPAPCVRAKVKDEVRHHVLVKTPTEAEVGPVLAACVKAAKVPRGVKVAIDVDAHDLM